MAEFTHLNASGLPQMVNVTEKAATQRAAKATAVVHLHADCFEVLKAGKLEKGYALPVAQVAGILAAKNTAQLIPLCHPIALTGADLSFTLDDTAHTVTIESCVHCKGETGVEMEALSAVTAAALTLYDMCKALQKDIVITDIRLLSKTGGKADYTYG